MPLFNRMLAVLYTLGAFLHLLDVLDLRLELSAMSTVWKVWIWYLLVFDSIAAIGLWHQKRWGVAAFLVIAVSQLIAYSTFRSVFGRQDELIAFHLITLAIFAWLSLRRHRFARS